MAAQCAEKGLAPILTGWEERQEKRQRKIEGGDGAAKNEHRRRRLTRIEATEVLLLLLPYSVAA